MATARCDNCGKVSMVEDLAEPSHIWERVDEDGPEPAGECPACGALAYEESEGQRTVRELAESIPYSDGADGDDEGGVDALIDYKNALEDRVMSLVDGDPKAEPAYTVIGRYRDNDQTWIETVYAREPDGVPALARRVCSEQSEIPLDELDLDIVAIFEGEPAIHARGDEVAL